MVAKKGVAKPQIQPIAERPAALKALHELNNRKITRQNCARILIEHVDGEKLQHPVFRLPANGLIIPTRDRIAELEVTYFINRLVSALGSKTMGVPEDTAWILGCVISHWIDNKLIDESAGLGQVLTMMQSILYPSSLELKLTPDLEISGERYDRIGFLYGIRILIELNHFKAEDGPRIALFILPKLWNLIQSPTFAAKAGELVADLMLRLTLSQQKEFYENEFVKKWFDEVESFISKETLDISGSKMSLFIPKALYIIRMAILDYQGFPLSIPQKKLVAKLSHHVTQLFTNVVTASISASSNYSVTFGALWSHLFLYAVHSETICKDTKSHISGWRVLLRTIGQVSFGSEVDAAMQREGFRAVFRFVAWSRLIANIRCFPNTIDVSEVIYEVFVHEKCRNFREFWFTKYGNVGNVGTGQIRAACVLLEEIITGSLPDLQTLWNRAIEKTELVSSEVANECFSQDVFGLMAIVDHINEVQTSVGLATIKQTVPELFKSSFGTAVPLKNTVLSGVDVIILKELNSMKRLLIGDALDHLTAFIGRTFGMAELSGCSVKDALSMKDPMATVSVLTNMVKKNLVWINYSALPMILSIITVVSGAYKFESKVGKGSISEWVGYAKGWPVKLAFDEITVASEHRMDLLAMGAEKLRFALANLNQVFQDLDSESEDSEKWVSFVNNALATWSRFVDLPEPVGTFTIRLLAIPAYLIRMVDKLMDENLMPKSIEHKSFLINARQEMEKLNSVASGDSSSILSDLIKVNMEISVDTVHNLIPAVKTYRTILMAGHTLINMITDNVIHSVDEEAFDRYWDCAAGNMSDDGSEVFSESEDEKNDDSSGDGDDSSDDGDNSEQISTEGSENAMKKASDEQQQQDAYSYLLSLGKVPQLTEEDVVLDGTDAMQMLSGDAMIEGEVEALAAKKMAERREIDDFGRRVRAMKVLESRAKYMSKAVATDFISTIKTVQDWLARLNDMIHLVGELSAGSVMGKKKKNNQQDRQDILLTRVSKFVSNMTDCFAMTVVRLRERPPVRLGDEICEDAIMLYVQTVLVLRQIKNLDAPSNVATVWRPFVRYLRVVTDLNELVYSNGVKVNLKKIRDSVENSRELTIEEKQLAGSALISKWNDIQMHPSGIVCTQCKQNHCLILRHTESVLASVPDCSISLLKTLVEQNVLLSPVVMQMLLEQHKSSKKRCREIIGLFHIGIANAIKLACLAEDYDRAMTEATKNLECLNSLGDAESIVDMVHRAVSSRRGAIRILCPSITNEVGTNYREELIEDLLRLISNAMDVINKVTEGPKHDVQIEIHMMKLKADLHRYRSEFTQDDCSLPIYEKAATLAEKHLSHTHPLRIKLALTHAVALFNVGKEREARSILTKASDALSINNNNTTGDDQEIKIFTNIIKQKLAISQH